MGILERLGDQGDARDAHLFSCYAVTDGRWGARASMAGGHDDRVPIFLDFLPKGRIVLRVGAGFSPEYQGDTRHVPIEPKLNLMQEGVGAMESGVHEIDGFAIERVEARRHRNQLYGWGNTFGVDGRQFDWA